MMCPLILQGKMIDVRDNMYVVGECNRDNCAWWHEYKDNNGTTHSACAIQHIAEAVKK